MGNGQKQNSAADGFSLTAPKDIFDRKNICYADGRRIACKGIKEAESEKRYALIYYLSNTVQLDSFISILRAFESEEICLGKCMCYCYDDDNHPIFYGMDTVEDVWHLDRLSNPCIDFSAQFCDRETRLYRFSLVASINSTSLIYCVEAKNFNERYGK